jgi:hypothetical protein
VRSFDIEVGTNLKVKKNLFWSDGKRSHLHLRKGETVVVCDVVLCIYPGEKAQVIPRLFVKGHRAMRQTHGNEIAKEYSPFRKST